MSKVQARKSAGVRVGVDVGGTNTDAVLMDGDAIVAWTKRPTTEDVSSGIGAAIAAVLTQAGMAPESIRSVMIGTTHFANALVERNKLEQVGILRLASPSGEALPPLTGWPAELARCIGDHIFLLPGGFEVDGREIAAFDEARVRDAVRTVRERGVSAIAIISAFAPIDPSMEARAAAIVAEEHPGAMITLSSKIGRIGFIERENAAVLNATLSSLAAKVVSSFERALQDLTIAAPLFISQNDGTLISAAEAAAYPVLTIGSGPTNSMRGAAFLTGVQDAIVMDVGGTTTDIGVLGNGFPRESSIAVDIGGVRTNFRMPDVLSIGLGGGTRVHLDQAGDLENLRIGPDSVGYRIAEEAMLFGGTTLTTSDVAVAAGRADFGDVARLPDFGAPMLDAVWARIQAMLEDGVDRMKTARGDATILAVGGGNFLIPETLKGAARVVRPPDASVANAVGAAIAQVGAQIDRIVNYDKEPRVVALDSIRKDVAAQVVAAGGTPESVQIVDIDEVVLSYLPGHSAQLRIKAVGDLALAPGTAAARCPSPVLAQNVD